MAAAHAAAKGQVHPATGAAAVHEFLACPDRFGHALQAASLFGPQGWQQAVVGVIGQAHRVGLVAEGQHRQHRPEFLLAR